MGARTHVFLLLSVIQICTTSAVTQLNDLSALNALQNIWENTPPTWIGADPCGDRWEGIGCSNSRVISIALPSMGLKGHLSGDIASLFELQILDLSYNKGLQGPLPASIGNLKKLTNLIMVGCSFSGPIPESIGSLSRLIFLSLNSNAFSGSIPQSIGNLSNIYWLDLADNQLDGSIPVSKGTIPGLDNLLNAKHFHFGRNQLSGKIPSRLFNSRMTLLHVLFESNNLNGSIPSTLSLVQSLEVVRFDRNLLTGSVPSSINELTTVSELILSNNRFTGTIPNLMTMTVLNYLDMSNNSFDASPFPRWLLNMKSLTTLMMESTQLKGQVPELLFPLPQLQTVILRNNQLNGTLSIGVGYSSQLQLIDLQNNYISSYTHGSTGTNQVDVILTGNPICEETGVTRSYCVLPQLNSSYTTPTNNCLPISCPSDQNLSPNCKCAYSYTGLLVFRAPSFSNLKNAVIFKSLEDSLMKSCLSQDLPVDSVSVRNARKDQFDYLDVNLELFPSVDDRFNRTSISGIGFLLSNQTFKPPDEFGPFFFLGDEYLHFLGLSSSTKSPSTGIIIGTVLGGSILLILLLLAGIYGYNQKKKAKKATDLVNPFARWESSKTSGGVPQLKGVKCFSFEELKKYANNFSENNDIGSGGYGKVYKGTLPSGQLIAIKRAKPGSMQGAVEFKTEIELLSRVHHKNVVTLLGFCFERGEQMLAYEFVPCGTLDDSLSGKTMIRLDWKRRLKIALGAARGLAYLHELADPPIIHRDIKSANILLDQHFTAKVADFGLSKPLCENEKSHVTTQVKGTLGYLDPEYYMTQQLTEKSDVYSFGVVMLELISGRPPIHQGKHIVREVRIAMNKAKDLYNLQELLDQEISLHSSLQGINKFVDLAMKCVLETGAERPAMGEVVKEIENILQIAGLNPDTKSCSTSADFDEASRASPHHPCFNAVFNYDDSFHK